MVTRFPPMGDSVQHKLFHCHMFPHRTVNGSCVIVFKTETCAPQALSPDR